MPKVVCQMEYDECLRNTPLSCKVFVILRETKDPAQVCIFNLGTDSSTPAQNDNMVPACGFPLPMSHAG